MGIILFFFSLLLSFIFINYRYVTIFLIARTFGILILHYIYFYIYPDTNGLSPAYNDEIQFITEASIGNFDFDFFDYLFNPSTAPAYINFLRIFNESVFDLALFAKMINNLFFIMILFYILKFTKYFRIKKREQTLILWLLIISPSFIFFTSLVLRDVIVSSILLATLYYLIASRYFLFFINSSFLIFLRKHLLLSLYFALIITYKRIKIRYNFMLALLILSIMSIFNFPFFGLFFENLKIYFYEFWISLVGLNFLIADSSSFIVSPIRVFIQRLIAFDTFLPQVYLIYLLLRYRNIVVVHKLTYIYIMCNLLYLYFYWLAGNTAARPTILPFIPIVYVQLFYYLNMVKNHKYSQSHSIKNSLN